MLPLVKSATLTRIPIVAITSAIVVAAFGVEALAARASDADRRRAMVAGAGAALAIAAAILAALAMQRSFLLRSMLSVETWRWSLWALLLAAGTWLALVAFARRYLERGPVVVALTVIVALDLFVAGAGFHRLQPADRVYPAVAELTRLQREPGPFRVVGAKGALMPNSALVYGLQDVRAYDGLGVAWYADLLDAALAWAQAHQQHELHGADSRVLDLLGVRYLLAPPEFPVDPAHWDRVAEHDRAALSQPPRAAPRGARRRLRRSPPHDARRRLRDGAIDLRRDVAARRRSGACRSSRAGRKRGRGRHRAHRGLRARARRDRHGRAGPPPARAVGHVVPRLARDRRRDAGADRARQRRLPRRRRCRPAGIAWSSSYAPASFRIGAAISGAALLLIAGWTALAERRRRTCAPGPA